MPVKKVSELDEISTLASGDIFHVPQDQGGGTYLSKKITYANVASEIITDANLGVYAKLDGTNQPFTGDLNISKTTPSITLTDGGSKITKLTRDATLNTATLTSDTITKITGYAQNMASNRGTITSLTLGTIWTMECWAKFTNTVNGRGNYGMLGYQDGSNYWFYFSGKTTFYYAFGAATATWSGLSDYVTDQAWRHFLVTRNGVTLELFINGVSQGTKTLASSPSVSINTFGSYGTDNTYYIPGSVDEIVLWNKVLSGAEIAARYASGNGLEATASADTIGIWHCNEAGLLLSDSSASARTMTLTAAQPVTGKVSPPALVASTKNILKVVDGVNADEAAVITYGNYDGLTGSYNLFNGLTHRFDTTGSINTTVDQTGLRTTGRFYTGLGTALLPAVTAIADTNTGMYYSGADDLGLATNGSSRMLINSSGHFSFATGGFTFATFNASSVGIGGLNGTTASTLGVQNTGGTTTRVTQVNKAVTNQTADLLQIQNSGGTAVAGFAAGGAIYLPYVAKTANYTLTTADHTVDCTSNSFTITLPTAVNIQGRIYNIKNTGSGVITLATTSSQTVDGNASGTLTLVQWDCITVQSTGANWIII